MMNATQESVAVTSVFWNIGKCPVPPGFDAGRVGPCIKRFLEKSGYSAPLTITAIGNLAGFPPEDLRALSSTGVVLNMVPYDRYCVRDLDLLRQFGFNIILPYPFRPAEGLWQNFLRAESGALEADKCIETRESAWVCSACFTPTRLLGLTGKGFANFLTHISSEEHAHHVIELCLNHGRGIGSLRRNHVGILPLLMPQPKTWQFSPLRGCPRYATTMEMIQPKTQPHMFATPSEYHGKDEPEGKRKRV